MSEEESFYGEIEAEVAQQNAEIEAKAIAKEASMRKIARKFFTGEGKEIYYHLLHDVCGIGQTALDVENTHRMVARCAKQEVGMRIRQLVEEKFEPNNKDEK